MREFPDSRLWRLVHLIPWTSSELLLSEWSLTTLESSEFGLAPCSVSGWTKSVSMLPFSVSVLFVPVVKDKYNLLLIAPKSKHTFCSNDIYSRNIELLSHNSLLRVKILFPKKFSPSLPFHFTQLLVVEFKIGRFIFFLLDKQ